MEIERTAVIMAVVLPESGPWLLVSIPWADSRF